MLRPSTILATRTRPRLEQAEIPAEREAEETAGPAPRPRRGMDRPGLDWPDRPCGAAAALEVFKQKGAELLLVIDEFGSLQGLITLDDIIEEIVGDEDVERQAKQRQDGSWLLDGLLPIDDFKEIFKMEELPHETEYESLSGFVMMSLGRVPQATDHFEWNGLRFEVMDMDGRRVDKVLVTTRPPRSAVQPADSAQS